MIINNLNPNQYSIIGLDFLYYATQKIIFLVFIHELRLVYLLNSR